MQAAIPDAFRRNFTALQKFVQTGTFDDGCGEEGAASGGNIRQQLMPALLCVHAHCCAFQVAKPATQSTLDAATTFAELSSRRLADSTLFLRFAERVVADTSSFHVVCLGQAATATAAAGAEAAGSVATRPQQLRSASPRPLRPLAPTSTSLAAFRSVSPPPPSTPLNTAASDKENSAGSSSTTTLPSSAAMLGVEHFSATFTLCQLAATHTCKLLGRCNEQGAGAAAADSDSASSSFSALISQLCLWLDRCVALARRLSAAQQSPEQHAMFLNRAHWITAAVLTVLLRPNAPPASSGDGSGSGDGAAAALRQRRVFEQQRLPALWAAASRWLLCGEDRAVFARPSQTAASASASPAPVPPAAPNSTVDTAGSASSTGTSVAGQSGGALAAVIGAAVKTALEVEWDRPLMSTLRSSSVAICDNVLSCLVPDSAEDEGSGAGCVPGTRQVAELDRARMDRHGPCALFPQEWITALQEEGVAAHDAAIAECVAQEQQQQQQQHLFPLATCALRLLVHFVHSASPHSTEAGAQQAQQPQHQRQLLSGHKFLERCVLVSATDSALLASCPRLPQTIESLVPLLQSYGAVLLVLTSSTPTTPAVAAAAAQASELFMWCKSITCLHAVLSFDVQAEASGLLALCNHHLQQQQQQCSGGGDGREFCRRILRALPPRVRALGGGCVAEVLALLSADDPARVCAAGAVDWRCIYGALRGAATQAFALQIASALVHVAKRCGASGGGAEQVVSAAAACARSVLLRCVALNKSDATDAQQVPSFFAPASSQQQQQQQPSIPSELHATLCLAQCCEFVGVDCYLRRQGDVYAAREVLLLPLLVALKVKRSLLLGCALRCIAAYNGWQRDGAVVRHNNGNNNNNGFDARAEMWGATHLSRQLQAGQQPQLQSLQRVLPPGVAVACLELAGDDLVISRVAHGMLPGASRQHQPMRRHVFRFAGLGKRMLEWLQTFDALLLRASQHLKTSGAGATESQLIAALYPNGDGSQQEQPGAWGGEQKRVKHDDDDDVDNGQNGAGGDGGSSACAATNARDEQRKRQFVAAWAAQRREFDRLAKQMVLEDLSADVLLAASALLACRPRSPPRGSGATAALASLLHRLQQQQQQQPQHQQRSARPSDAATAAEDAALLASLVTCAVPRLVAVLGAAPRIVGGIVADSESQHASSFLEHRSQQQRLGDDDDNSSNPMFDVPTAAQGEPQQQRAAVRRIDGASSLQARIVEHVAARLWEQLVLPALAPASPHPNSASTAACSSEFVRICRQIARGGSDNSGAPAAGPPAEHDAAVEAEEKMVLVLPDARLRNIPWERCGVFLSPPPTAASNNSSGNVSNKKSRCGDWSVVYRAPSLDFIFQCYSNESGRLPLRRVGATSCVIDPARDMRQRSVDVYRRLVRDGAWRGIVSGRIVNSSDSASTTAAPVPTNTATVFTGRTQVLLYAGHGGPECGQCSIFPRRDMLHAVDNGGSGAAPDADSEAAATSSSTAGRFPVVPFAVVLALGCSSARAAVAEPSSSSPRRCLDDPFAAAPSWLVAGCTHHVGMLWDVSDTEIDRIAKRALRVFYGMPSSSSSSLSGKSAAVDGAVDTSTEEEEEEQRGAVRSAAASVGRPDLPEAFLHAAMSACTLPFLSGAGLCCYGVPGIAVRAWEDNRET